MTYQSPREEYQPEYHETRNNQTEAEKLDARNYRIESETDYDVLNWDRFTIDIMDRTGIHGEAKTVDIYGRSTDEIIETINRL